MTWELAGWRGEGCAPFGRVDIAGVLGEEPAVPVEVKDAVLALSVDGLVQFLDYHCALLAGSGVVGVDAGWVDVIQENGEHLGAGTGDGGTFAAFSRAGNHDDGVAEAHLDAADGVAVAIELGEAEDAGEPGSSFRDVAVNEMGQQGIAGDGAVVHGDSMQRSPVLLLV